MDGNKLVGLSPLWLISLAMVLGTVIVVLIPSTIAGGDAIKSSDWIGFAGNVVAGTMTILAAIIAWAAVQRQIVIQQEIADGQAAFQRFQILQQQLTTLEEEYRLCSEIKLRAHGALLVTATYFCEPHIVPWQVDSAREGLHNSALELDAIDDRFDVSSTRRWAFQAGFNSRHEIGQALVRIRMAVTRAKHSLALIPKGAKVLSSADEANCLAIDFKNEVDVLTKACDLYSRAVSDELWRLGSISQAMRKRAGL
jgi:hypothetical protein